MRLIDADALVQMLENDAKHMEDITGRMWTYAAINDIKNAPTADVVEVVRCKDCRHFDMSDIGGTIPPIVYRCKRFARTYRQAEDFCSYGERKETEDA